MWFQLAKMPLTTFVPITHGVFANRNFPHRLRGVADGCVSSSRSPPAGVDRSAACAVDLQRKYRILVAELTADVRHRIAHVDEEPPERVAHLMRAASMEPGLYQPLG
jgi:hypothetical protein